METMHKEAGRRQSGIRPRYAHFVLRSAHSRTAHTPTWEGATFCARAAYVAWGARGMKSATGLNHGYTVPQPWG